MEEVVAAVHYQALTGAAQSLQGAVEALLVAVLARRAVMVSQGSPVAAVLEAAQVEAACVEAEVS